MDDGNDLLMSGGTPWCKFPTVGTVVTGTVVGKVIQQQQREYDDPSKLAFWEKSGEPKMEVVIKLQTTERDPKYAGDDGVRALHVGDRSNMHAAVRTAVRLSGAGRVAEGGTLTVTYTGDEVPTGRNKPAKEYSAVYVPPLSGGNAALMGDATASIGTAAVDPGRTVTVNLPSGPPPLQRPESVPEVAWENMNREQQERIVEAMSVGASSNDAPPF